MNSIIFDLYSLHRRNLKIAINTRFLLGDKLEGFGWFTLETTKRLVQQHPEVEFHFFFDRPYQQEHIFGDNVIPHVLFPPARHPFLFYWWFELSVNRMLKKIKPDLFFSPDGFLNLRTNVPQIGVIHDINFEHYPKDLKLSHRLFYRFFFPKYAKKAQRLITVSEFSKQDIISHYNIPSNRIDVVYNGINSKYHPISKEEQIQVRNQHTDGAPYFVYLGSLHPRKNIIRLIKAFDQFKQKINSPFKLMIIGGNYWWNSEMQQTLDSLICKDEVIFKGHVPIEDVNLYLGAAEALTYVSYFEGFGIPLIEGMQCGIPVISGDKTSLPEVGADAVYYVDPFSVESISNGMLKIAENDELKKTLIEKGNRRAKDFSWDKTAEGIWKSIQQIVTS